LAIDLPAHVSKVLNCCGRRSPAVLPDDERCNTGPRWSPKLPLAPLCFLPTAKACQHAGTSIRC